MQMLQENAAQWCEKELREKLVEIVQKLEDETQQISQYFGNKISLLQQQLEANKLEADGLRIQIAQMQTKIREMNAEKFQQQLLIQTLYSKIGSIKSFLKDNLNQCLDTLDFSDLPIYPTLKGSHLDLDPKSEGKKTKDGNSTKINISDYFLKSLASSNTSISGEKDTISQNSPNISFSSFLKTASKKFLEVRRSQTSKPSLNVRSCFNYDLPDSLHGKGNKQKLIARKIQSEFDGFQEKQKKTSIQSINKIKSMQSFDRINPQARQTHPSQNPEHQYRKNANILVQTYKKLEFKKQKGQKIAIHRQTNLKQRISGFNQKWKLFSAFQDRVSPSKSHSEQI